MKKLLFSLVVTAFFLLSVSCFENESGVQASVSSQPEQDVIANEAEVTKIAMGLADARFLGTTLSNFEAEEMIYSMSFTSFYCFYHSDYPEEIKAEEYEPFVKEFFGVSPEFLHKLEEYDPIKKSYLVYPELTISKTHPATDHFQIDRIFSEEGTVKIDYHTVWGDYAESGISPEDTLFAGTITLVPNKDSYRVVSILVTTYPSQ